MGSAQRRASLISRSAPHISGTRHRWILLGTNPAVFSPMMVGTRWVERVFLCVAVGLAALSGCAGGGVGVPSLTNDQPAPSGVCGGFGRPCCYGDGGFACSFGLACGVDRVCRSATTTPPPTTSNQSCGRYDGDVCCANAACSGGLACCGSVCRVPGACGGVGGVGGGSCGLTGQACCPTGQACHTSGDYCLSGVCQRSSHLPPGGSPSQTPGSCGTLLGGCCNSYPQCGHGLNCVVGLCLPDDGSGPDDGSWEEDDFGAGARCYSSGQSGTCIDTYRTSCQGTLRAGLCGGDSSVQCCLSWSGSTGSTGSSGAGASCYSSGQRGTCIDTDRTSCRGTLRTGLCAGDNSVRCCLPSSTWSGSGSTTCSGTCYDRDVEYCSGAQSQTGGCNGGGSVACCPAGGRVIDPSDG